MASSLLAVFYCALILILVPVIISLEISSRRARVFAAPSTPWMRRLVIRRLKEVAESQQKDTPVIYELGAGWGTLALAAARACPEAQVIGYDLAPVPLMVARLHAFFGRVRNVRFMCRDFFTQDLSDADIILTYLTENLMNELGVKISCETKPGTVLICNTFGIHGWTPVQVDTGQNFVLKLSVLTYEVGRSAPVSR